MKPNFKIQVISFLVFLMTAISVISAQKLPNIISDKKVMSEIYLPDFSYAGYHNGERSLPQPKGTILLASNHGVISNDGLDDSKALLKAIEEAGKIKGNVILQLPIGRIILSEIIYIERSNFVLRGAGTGKMGTEIYFPRPLMYTKDPEGLQELREYLIQFDKRQIEKENNINLPFSQYAWTGGFIWIQIPGERVKSYLGKYDKPKNFLAKVTKGNRGEKTFFISEVNNLKVGDVVQLELFNKNGENGVIIKDLYKNTKVKVGSHHWAFPTLPIVRQQIEIVKISDKKITIKTPLTIEIKPEYQAQLVEWKHLKEIGIEHLRITFPDAPRVAHHVEPGYNGIFLTRIFNSWVKDVVIHNSDSGILTEEISNVTIKDIVTTGKNMAHYTVAMAAVHNVLVNNLKVYNDVVHPLSFNTFSTKNVYQNCEVFKKPVLDQHSGANHQNLFDNITVHLAVNEDNSYPLFTGGGAGYWKPSHGAYSTFWNINVQIENKLNNSGAFLLNGMKNGPFARLIGVHGNHDLKISYDPKAYIEFTNYPLTETPSLYSYQLKKRLEK